MAGRIDQREAIAAALQALDSQPLGIVAPKFFSSMGYASDRRIPITTSRQFQEQLDPHGRLTAGELDALGQLKSLHFLFQLTEAELDLHGNMFDDAKAVHETKIESYLFFAAELPDRQYSRSSLSTLVRAVNKPLPMPALVLFRHGGTVSLGMIHRRLHKRDQARDVLDKVTLIKDITCVDPIRAHLEILNDFVLPNLDVDFGVSSFVRLHEAWQKRLSSYALSNDFYREIADWYFWAHHQVEDDVIQLPQHCDTEEEQSLFLIRLLTRVIFCWFLVEKRLIPTDLFREHRLMVLIKDFNISKDPTRQDRASTYYHAILQNLFFGTLNMPSEHRGFREKKKEGERYDKNYGITNLWRYENDFRSPAEWLALAGRVPFLNGGLFDCLDEKIGKKEDNFILDGFSDNPKLACHLPNDLFFGPERTVDLSRDYGEEDKRTARSKKAKVRGLIDILSRYKFTIEENTPLEEEIALDPELLGKVFENLLASYNEDTATTARKALGAYYTPREIVSYMVDEALKSYLGSQVPRCKGALEDLFSNKATLKEVKPDTREALIAAIGRVKILDPACGSGAFPMGALHRLVDLLQKLDPNNESWKRDRLAEARRHRQLLEDSAGAKEEIAAWDARIADIEKSFDSRFHALDFARKLYLIENAIYGVDILPIATQIAKLRFFISLVVDQKVDPKAPNLGVRPLPNLETRLVAADSLIPIDKEETNLFSGEIDKLRADLAAIRHEHFNARSPSSKRKWREADETKRNEIAKLLEDNHFLTHQTAKKVAAWDPYDQNSHASFFDSEWMFGFPVGKVKIDRNAPATLLGNLSLVNEAGGQIELMEGTGQEIDSGFDIVIGNPPYVRIQTLKKKDPKLVSFFKEHYASAAKGNYDLYVIFVEAGLRLLRHDGHLAYICPHKFFNSDYGVGLRALISKGRHLRHVVHFGDEQVFPGASIYTCLLFLAKAGSTDCRFVKAHNLQAWMLNLQGQEAKFPASTITASGWNFQVGTNSRVFEQLQQIPTKLGEVASRISQGIRTSANEVYVLDVLAKRQGRITAFSKELDTEVVLESKGVWPFLQGREIKPYCVMPSTKVVIIPYELDSERMELMTFSKITETFPLVAEYLLKNRKVLQAREEGRMQSRNWYAYIYPKNLDVMMQPKLLVPDIADRACFALDEDGRYAFTSGYGITFRDESKHPMKFMLGLCNSRVLEFYWKQVSTPLRGGFFRYFTQFIEQFPVAHSTLAQRGVISTLVDYLLYLNGHFTRNLDGPSTRDPLMLAYWERLLNGLIYQLYFAMELDEAGLNIFQLIEQVQLPEIDDIRELERLSRLRRMFEALYEGTHPVRIALDKLQTLDIVRIIEGTT
jgi:adenine-specific DNA-methyltransferase